MVCLFFSFFLSVFFFTKTFIFFSTGKPTDSDTCMCLLWISKTPKASVLNFSCARFPPPTGKRKVSLTSSPHWVWSSWILETSRDSLAVTGSRHLTSKSDFDKKPCMAYVEDFDFALHDTHDTLTICIIVKAHKLKGF